jgi:hypothetical protein
MANAAAGVADCATMPEAHFVFFGDMQKLWVIVRLPFWPLGEDLMSCRSTKMAVPIGFAMGEWKVV